GWEHNRGVESKKLGFDSEVIDSEVLVRDLGFNGDEGTESKYEGPMVRRRWRLNESMGVDGKTER
ncbi:hypothetical protein L195_g048707, partial [Trifolium pratense]